MDKEAPSTPQKRNWLTLAHWAALAWLVAIVVGYFVMHKPITPAFTLSLLGICMRLGVSAALLSIAGGLGRRLVSLLELHPLAQASIQAALGLGLLSLGTLAVGAAGGFYPWFALLALLTIGVLVWREILPWWRSWASLGSLWKASHGIGRAIAFLTLAILGATLLVALSPPVQFDALTYHLALPRIYLDAHRLIYVAQNMFWGMPQIAEMLYTWSMSLAGASAALVLGWSIGLLAMLGLLGLLAQYLGVDPAWAGIAALLGGFTLASGLDWGYSDWWIILFGVCFLALVISWNASDRYADLALAGVFAGFALGVKYTGGILLICGVVVILVRRRHASGQLVRSLLWFGLPALMVFVPWLMRDYLATGNPVYPLIFPAGAMTRLRLALYQGGQPWGSWLDVLLLPVRATLWGVEGGPGYSASIGPLLLGLGLAAGLGWRSRPPKERSVIRLALLMAISGIVIWMIAGRFSSYLLQSRLYLALFPVLALLAAAGYAGFSRIVQDGVRLGVIVGFLVCLVFGLNAIEVGLRTIQMNAVQQDFGLISGEEYVLDRLGWFGPAMQAVRELPPGSKTLLLWEPRSLYCLPVCEPDEVLDRWLRERYDGRSRDPATPDEILQKWRGKGYTHLLYYKLGADFVRQEDQNYHPQDWQALQSLLSKIPQIDDFGDTYLLYRLVP